jgi:hypothetical protein
MTIEEYIDSGVSLEMDNSQTRAIAGDVSTPFGACTDAMLERAKRNLDASFAVAGLTERFDETLVLLGERFGWSHLYFVRANVAPQGPTVELSDDARRLIAEHNRLDDELYAYVTERFEAAKAGSPTFQRNLARFERGNDRYRRWGTITRTYPHRLASGLGLRRVWSRGGVQDL